MKDRNYYVTVGYNAFVIGQTAFQCPFKDKQQMLAWMEGYTEAKKRRAIRCK